MPTLHLFNPEHDIALAQHVPRFTPPRPALHLRRDLGFLPMIWAADGDWVLVDDVPLAAAAVQCLGLPVRGQLVGFGAVQHRLHGMDASALRLAPWGWDLAVVDQLERAGVPFEILPSEFDIEAIREASSRSWAAEYLLPRLRALSDDLTGEMWEVYDMHEVTRRLAARVHLMVKQPWSGSGRGVRRLEWSDCRDGTEMWRNMRGWMDRTMRDQGCIMMEPLYNKVEDFGMEFSSDGRGGVHYCGLSLFHTVNGAYVGNWLASEDEKRRRLQSYGLPDSLFRRVAESIASTMSASLRGVYSGPFGVDMMIVSEDGRAMLHPCVEMNLRRTMGHVALDLRRLLPHGRGAMRVDYDGSYKLVVDFQE